MSDKSTDLDESLIEAALEDYRKRLPYKENLRYKNWILEFEEKDAEGFSYLWKRACYFALEQDQQLVDSVSHESDTLTRVLRTLATKPFEGKLVGSFQVLADQLDHLKQAKFIVLIGAGVSFESYVGDWTVLDCLAQCLDVPRKVIEEDYRKHGLRFKWWNELNARGLVSLFQNRLYQSVEQTSPSRSHEIVKEYFTKTKIWHLICFNWDHLIEKGSRISIVIGQRNPHPDARFWKPHGSTLDLSEPWIFPNEEPVLNPSLHKFCRTTLSVCLGLVIGFSGDPKAFTLKHVRDLLPKNVFVMDIRPLITDANILGDELISLTAAYFFHWLSERVAA